MSKPVPPPVQDVMYKPHPSEKMLACQYMGPKSMQIGSVPKPMVTAPKDAIVRITHCTICGSDLHMYVGELDSAMQRGDIMGHEAIGVVDEVGPEVKEIQKGDRVIILPVICCGECFYCKRQEYSLCDKTNPSPEMDKMWGHRLSGIFGYTQLCGGYPGDQAEYCRVPNADLVLVKAPKEGVSPGKLLALADVTTTAWHGCELAEVGKGHTVAVWGCGPIGLSIQKLSFFRGASKVYAIDPDPQRLKIAESFGCIPVNVTEHKDVSDYLLEKEPHGVDKGIEASGFRSAQSLVHKTMRTTGVEGDQSDTIAAAIRATRKGGNLALIGDFFFSTNEFPIGALMEKTITLRGGQLFAQKYHPYLLDITVKGEYDPSFVFTHKETNSKTCPLCTKCRTNTRCQVDSRLWQSLPTGVSLGRIASRVTDLFLNLKSLRLERAPGVDFVKHKCYPLFLAGTVSLVCFKYFVLENCCCTARTGCC